MDPITLETVAGLATVAYLFALVCFILLAFLSCKIDKLNKRCSKIEKDIVITRKVIKFYISDSLPETTQQLADQQLLNMCLDFLDE